MSAHPITPQIAISADREFLIRRSMTKGYQYFSLLMPPLYTGLVLSRRRMGAAPWTINRMLRTTWIGGIAGVAQGGAFEYFRTKNETEDTLRIRRINAMYNLSSLRADDHSTIGAILGALLTPALFWRRARSVHLFLGGAGIGAGAGMIAHWTRNVTEEPLPQGPSLPISKASGERPQQL